VFRIALVDSITNTNAEVKLSKRTVRSPRSLRRGDFAAVSFAAPSSLSDTSGEANQVVAPADFAVLDARSRRPVGASIV
jgi:hypothetical protein